MGRRVAPGSLGTKQAGYACRACRHPVLRHPVESGQRCASIVFGPPGEYSGFPDGLPQPCTCTLSRAEVLQARI